MFTNFDNFINEWNDDYNDDYNNYKYFDDKPLNKSFASHLNRYREIWKKLYGRNWENHVSREKMEDTIDKILDFPPDVLHMHFRERKWWKFKMFRDKKKHDVYKDEISLNSNTKKPDEILRIFYDAELALVGLSVNKKKRYYRNNKY